MAYKEQMGHRHRQTPVDEVPGGTPNLSAILDLYKINLTLATTSGALGRPDDTPEDSESPKKSPVVSPTSRPSWMAEMCKINLTLAKTNGVLGRPGDILGDVRDIGLKRENIDHRHRQTHKGIHHYLRR